MERHMARNPQAALLGLREEASEYEIYDAVRAGLPKSALAQLVAVGHLSREEANRIVPPRTLARRGERLTPEESDRVSRIARIIARARETLGDDEKTHRWLRKPNRALKGAVPLELAQTDAGARLVEAVLT